MTEPKTKVRAAIAHPYDGKIYEPGDTYMAHDEYIPALRAMGFIVSRGEDVSVADEPEADAPEPAKKETKASEPAKYNRRDMRAGK